MLSAKATYYDLWYALGIGSESNLVSWLDGGSKSSVVTQQHNTAVAGELVGVDVQISNPMALGLSLTQLRAVYEHDSGATGPVNEYVKVNIYCWMVLLMDLLTGHECTVHGIADWAGSCTLATLMTH